MQAGLERLVEARRVLERANFFRLLELYARGRAAVEAVLASYSGTEVGEQAEALLAEYDAGLSVLEAELDQDEVRRLKSIQAFLEATESRGSRPRCAPTWPTNSE